MQPRPPGREALSQPVLALPAKYLKTNLSEVVQLSDPADPHDGEFLTVLRLTRETPKESKNVVSWLV